MQKLESSDAPSPVSGTQQGPISFSFDDIEDDDGPNEVMQILEDLQNGLDYQGWVKQMLACCI